LLNIVENIAVVDKVKELLEAKRYMPSFLFLASSQPPLNFLAFI